MDLVILDMNGVMTKETLASELSSKYRPEAVDLIKSYYKSKKPVEQTVSEVGRIHKGLTKSTMDREASLIKPVPGADELVHELRKKYAVAILSGDYINLTEKIAEELGVDMFASNEAIYDSLDVHTGEIRKPYMVSERKAIKAQEIMKKLGMSSNNGRLFCIGDDDINLGLCNISDFSIAYNASDNMKRSASVYLDTENILDILKLKYL